MKKKSSPSTRSFLSVVALLSLMGGSTSNLWSQENNGNVSASFLEVTPSLRAAALGGDQVAAQGHLEDMFANPAGLVSLQGPQLWLTHHESFINTKYETLGFGLPMKNHVLGFAARYIDEGSIDRVGIDANGNPQTDAGQFRPYTALVQGAWAGEWRGTAVGVAAKVWRENLDKTSSQGFAGDAGILKSFFASRLDLGAAVRNAGPRVNGFSLPTSLGLGAAYHLNSFSNLMKHVTLFSEWDKAAYRPDILRVGAELDQGNVWLRGGYQITTSNSSDFLNKFSIGAGLRIKGFLVDYAWAPTGELGTQQRLALTIGFGLTAEEREKAAKELDGAMQKRMKDYSTKHMTAGQQAFEQHEWLAAQEEFSQAATWDPSNAEAQQKLVETRQQMKLEQTEELKQEGRRYEKQNQAEAAYNQGALYYLDGRYKEALAEWRKVERLNPDRPVLEEYIAKAKAAQSEQELHSAAKQSSALAEEVETLSQQAYTLYSLGQVDKAISLWEKVAVLAPDNEDTKLALREARNKRKILGGKDTRDTMSLAEQMNTEALQAYGEGRVDFAVETWRRAWCLERGNLKIKNNLMRAESELAVKAAK